MISVRLEGLFRWSETASQYGSDFIHQSRLEHFPGPAVQVFIESFAFRREPDFQCAKAFECASSLLEQFGHWTACSETHLERTHCLGNIVGMDSPRSAGIQAVELTMNRARLFLFPRTQAVAQFLVPARTGKQSLHARAQVKTRASRQNRHSAPLDNFRT